MAADGMAVQVACKVLGVAESRLYEVRERAPSERSIRHAMLIDLITQIHVESHGIYGGRRVHAELTAPARTSSGSRHHRAPDQTRRGLLRHPRHLLTSSRWLVDRLTADRCVVTNALGMAVDSGLDKRIEPGAIIRSDHGVQFGSWALTKRAKDSGLLASMGSTGDCYDNSMIESL